MSTTPEAPTNPPSPETGSPSKSQPLTTSANWVAGMALVLIGLLTLAGQYLHGNLAELLVLSALAGVLLVWGATARHAGPIIPGCIIAGVAVGNFLEKAVAAPGTPTGTAAILLSLALGFAAITPMTAIFAKGRQIWGLIVGAILAVIGGAFLLGGQGMRALEMAGQFAPLLLIALGIFLMIQQSRSNRSR